MPDITQLATDAGFTAAAQQAEFTRLLASRLAQAYEHYRFVTQGQVDTFNAKLKAQTLARSGEPGVNLYDHYDVLAFSPVSDYKAMPPADVLDKVKQAKERAIFDTFEVAQVQSVVEYKDPIVFGRITGCGDRFYITQWDSDVSIDDLLKPNEG